LRRSRPSAPERLSNTCTRRQEELCELFAQRDWSNFSRLFAPDFNGEDHRHGFVSFGAGPVAAFGAAAAVGVTRMASRAIATGGDHLALSVWETRHGDDDADVGEWLFLCEVDTDGRLASISSYDLDAIDAANRELDER
jgi:hypothetical protein